MGTLRPITDPSWLPGCWLAAPLMLRRQRILPEGISVTKVDPSELTKPEEIALLAEAEAIVCLPVRHLHRGSAALADCHRVTAPAEPRHCHPPQTPHCQTASHASITPACQ